MRDHNLKLHNIYQQGLAWVVLGWTWRGCGEVDVSIPFQCVCCRPLENKKRDHNLNTILKVFINYTISS